MLQGPSQRTRTAEQTSPFELPVAHKVWLELLVNQFEILFLRQQGRMVCGAHMQAAPGGACLHAQRITQLTECVASAAQRACCVPNGD